MELIPFGQRYESPCMLCFALHCLSLSSFVVAFNLIVGHVPEAVRECGETPINKGQKKRDMSQGWWDMSRRGDISSYIRLSGITLKVIRHPLSCSIDSMGFASIPKNVHSAFLRRLTRCFTLSISFAA